MSATLGAAITSTQLQANPVVTLSRDSFEYRISTTPRTITYEVTSGTSKLRAELLWFFGSSRTGQTYVYRHEGKLYESRVSYYPAVRGLDLTTGAANTVPANIAEAAGREMNSADVKDCFGCHASAPPRKSFAPPESAVPGVSCETCHGVADAHLSTQGRMRPLRKASSEEISDLCGTCHRTWAQVLTMKLKGVSTVRFQPYRLTQSKCYDSEDRRISCTACHDPHQPNETSLRRVDGACRACHSSAGNHKVCATSQSGCAECHLPKYEIPGVHTRFSDHRIRVVKAGERFPD